MNKITIEKQIEVEIPHVARTEEEFRKLYIDEGKSYKEIAKIFKISTATVGRYLRKFNLTKIRFKTFNDLSGQVYGQLTVIKYIRTGKYKEGGVFRVWECLCSCGNKLFVREGKLKRGHLRCKCGEIKCKSCASEYSSKQTQKCAIDYDVWYRMKQRAIKKGIEMRVTPEYLKELMEQQNYKCAITGINICFGKTRSKETTASPDRIDINKGYIPGNIRWVHKYINIMRNDKSTEDFIKWCKLVIEYNLGQAKIPKS